jgi:hypothetical protein
MTRGRCGSLLLHRDGLAPSTPCRSPGALRSTPVNGHRQTGPVGPFRANNSPPPNSYGPAALLWFRGERPSRRVPYRGPFANSVLLELNANNYKTIGADPIGMAYPSASHHVRSSFGLKDSGLPFPRNPTRPSCRAKAVGLREKRKFN